MAGVAQGSYEGRLYLAQEGRCFYCERLLDVAPDQTPQKKSRHPFAPGWTKEHVMPQLNGDGASAGNMNVVLCCRPCNQRKGSNLPTPQQLRKYHWLRRKMGQPTHFLENLMAVSTAASNTVAL